MIFLTVGTTEFNFDRLLMAVDAVMITGGYREKLVVQKGQSAYKFKYKYCKTFSEITFPVMLNILKKSRLVISHGGMGTVFLAVNHCKNKPLIIPRCQKFKEHVNNHQIFSIKVLKEKGLINAIFPEENLPIILDKFLQNEQKIGIKFYENDKLVKKLLAFTEKIKASEHS